MDDIKLVSVTYSLEISEETTRKSLSVDLLKDTETLPFKLMKLKGIKKVEYPIYTKSGLKITLTINNPKDIKTDPILWNKIVNIIEDHIN